VDEEVMLLEAGEERLAELRVYRDAQDGQRGDGGVRRDRPDDDPPD